MAAQMERAPLSLKLLALGFVLVWVFTAAFPFIWTVWGSFKVQADFFSYADWTDALDGPTTRAQTGSAFTLDAYRGVWIDNEFWRPGLNTLIVTFSVTAISLTFGTLGGYALARSGYRYAFWVLIAALIFRAMPGVTLVSGYLLPFFELNLWGRLPTAIIVLVALNQPFTLWLLHAFFLSIPRDLDESAMVDGCTRFQAFRLAIIPVMWPGVITAGIFSFLTGYNDFVISAAILSEDNQTMIPRIAAFLGSVQLRGQIMYAVAATVSVILPLIFLVLFFQKRIVSGLTAGAVKG
ncbi:carbohydrate ABC transporter permease [Rhodobacteraceae bacterium N5(2021)]|uniref:Carbohydrate ABC transporter permease n=1 Tax=Gymnodinialimonas phycosphaerae TaxID=2841589 RepID=A0A975TS75_9RHOB|nr:carbohydrate ABC transporter permease [Gymnodinialimonas phycosphaerae]MBY4893547.1 carbohydrate ABC transporter permease [Gymnodinialimonas phycosphaerae]